MFPDLAPKLQDAARIEITHQGKTTAIVKHGDTWGLEDRGGYVVQASKLRGMLTALTELRLVEQRTTDPEQFNRLGLEDPNGKTGTSNLLRVLDASGKPIVAVIVGHRRVRTQGNVPEQVYVRRPDDNQTWLAEGSLQVDADPQLWLDRDIMNIDHARIANVAVTHGDETLELARDGQKLVLKAPAEHPPLDDYKMDDVDRGLELLTFQDVQTDKEPVGDKVGQSVYTTSDGLAVTATVFKGEKDIWARFAATGNDKTKDEADKLNARLAGWTYQLGAWKQKALVPSLDDLKAPPPEKPAASLPSPAEAGHALPAEAQPGSNERSRVSRPADRRDRDRGHQGRHGAAGAPRQAAQHRRLDAARRRAGGRRDRRGGGAPRAARGDRPRSGHAAFRRHGGQHPPRRGGPRALPLHDHRLRHALGVRRAGRRDRRHRGGVGEGSMRWTITICGARRTA